MKNSEMTRTIMHKSLSPVPAGPSIEPITITIVPNLLRDLLRVTRCQTLSAECSIYIFSFNPPHIPFEMHMGILIFRFEETEAQRGHITQRDTAS